MIDLRRWQQLKNEAWFAKKRGNFREAEVLLMAALNEVNTNPLLQEEMSLTLNILANHYVDTGDITEAIRIAKYDVKIRREISNAPSLLGSSLLTLAGVLTEAGQFAEVIPVAEEGVAIYAEVLGETHPETDRLRNLLSEAKRKLADSSSEMPAMTSTNTV